MCLRSVYIYSGCYCVMYLWSSAYQCVIRLVLIANNSFGRSMPITKIRVAACCCCCYYCYCQKCKNHLPSKVERQEWECAREERNASPFSSYYMWFIGSDTLCNAESACMYARNGQNFNVKKYVDKHIILYIYNSTLIALENKIS